MLMVIIKKMVVKDAVILQLQQGSTKALEQLHRIYAAKIYQSCRKFYLEHEDAEEVVQDVFLKIWEVRERINPTKSFQAYLLKITRNIVIKKLQKKVMKVTIDKYINNFSYAENSIENYTNFQDTINLVDEIINNLPPQKQRIFLLNRYEDKSIEDIANELGISKRTVESHIYQARTLIKRKIDLNFFILSCSFSLFL